jgi:2-dehydro-3-deoxyglucarate aldolase
MTDLKAKLRNRELTIGSWLTIGHTAVAEIMAKVGFDWLTIDMEHSAITIAEAQKMVQVISLCDCPALIRVGENNANTIKRAMDTGAHGVIVPMVNSREEAVAAVRAVKYPPVGTRGVGLGRAQGYGLSFAEYRDWVNRESIVIVQIEHVNAVNNIEEILGVDGVDGFIVGPYDLSGSIGRPGQFDDPQMKDMTAKILETAQKLKKPAGFHLIPPEREKLLAKIDEGFCFIAFCLDTLLLGRLTGDIVREVKAVLKPRFVL